MVIRHKVEGFDAFVSKVEEITKDKSKTLIVLFSGTKDDSGKVVTEIKDPECIFRTDPRTQLRGVPTLMKWGTDKRLQGCKNKEMVEGLIKDD